VVERMRRSGAIIIGKTNVPEFGLGSLSYNPVYGTTLNAYDQSRTSGGSSGGASVAVALQMMAVTDGSDYMGSLRNPTTFNNVFGFRTCYGRVPALTRDVFLPSMGVVGPIARTVTVLAMLLAVRAGRSTWATSQPSGRSSGSGTSLCRTRTLITLLDSIAC